MASHESPSHESTLSVLAAGDVPLSLIKGLVAKLGSDSRGDQPSDEPEDELLRAAIAALEAFLQANVTGPVLPESLARTVESRFVRAWEEAASAKPTLDGLRKACLAYLEVDGVAPYAHIPYIELFALAHYAVNTALGGKPVTHTIELGAKGGEAKRHSLAWTRLRINAWHYRLLTQPSLGPGSTFTRATQWSEVPTLEGTIVDGIDVVSKQILNEEVWTETEDVWTTEEKVMFLVEAANDYILLGRGEAARELLREATKRSGLVYALTGALGKRTKFQEKSISQLVVLARSGTGTEAKAGDADEDEDEEAKPEDLELNNDTLLETISFEKQQNGDDKAKADVLPPALVDLAPDDQPQLSPLDQIILLTEATLKDAFSPADTLTSEEILPFAVRVISDKSTNWQIYTQALLVRSRIEVHRSKTVERGVLQLQAVADQVLTDTTAAAAAPAEENKSKEDDNVPAIAVTQPGQEPPSTAVVDKPTTFFPAPKPSESAPAHVRLQYIHTLATPPRWHLESELAYAWTGVGSLVSALEIFKRLRLWAEVALCLASSAAAGDEDGRGSGGEEKAKGIIRWRLFHRTGAEAAVEGADPDDEEVGDATQLRAGDFSGPERAPPPPNAPRLWCILGDLESEPAHYERAWAVSGQRYSRAQKSLAEHLVQKKDLAGARAAYRAATGANRLSPDMWSRLGDICLRLGDFEEAAESFSRSIGCATDTVGGEDARTWSNLGSALWSLYCEITAAEGQDLPLSTEGEKKDEDEDETPSVTEQADAEKQQEKKQAQTPSQLLQKSLAAYKKGASIAHTNWRIWDNVLTLSARLTPPSVPDMVLALGHVARIRASEDALDGAVLSALVSAAVLAAPRRDDAAPYVPPRGSHERLVVRLLEEEIVPLVTRRDDIWALVAKVRVWTRDYAGAIDAAERAWRCAYSGGGAAAASSLAAPSPGGTGSLTAGAETDWSSDDAAWDALVARTDELAGLMENYGPDVEGVGPRWRAKVRSAARSAMGKGRAGSREGGEGWRVLEGIMEGAKA